MFEEDDIKMSVDRDIFWNKQFIQRFGSNRKTEHNEHSTEKERDYIRPLGLWQETD